MYTHSPIQTTEHQKKIQLAYRNLIQGKPLFKNICFPKGFYTVFVVRNLNNLTSKYKISQTFKLGQNQIL